MPVISKNTGTQIELPSATAARSRGPTRPAMTASTKPIAVVASCAMMMGVARVSKLRSSAPMRAGRVEAVSGVLAGTEFTNEASTKEARKTAESTP
ncbi:hypothetical protein D3C76_1240670 [compost metagenome]